MDVESVDLNGQVVVKSFTRQNLPSAWLACLVSFEHARAGPSINFSKFIIYKYNEYVKEQTMQVDIIRPIKTKTLTI